MTTMEDTKRPIRLSNATLSDLPHDILRPTYDRTSLTPGIVHIGMGNFHRAHQAWYLHRLMQAGEARDWGILGAGIRPYDAEMREALLAQDCLTTLIELDPGRVSAEVIGSIIGYIPVEEGNRSLIARMSEAAIRIVSLTVTEGGYYLDPATKSFDTRHPDILHDAAHPDSPRTAFGAMVAALAARRAAGVTPFTCLSCDNLPGNGAILRAVVVALARLSDPALATWIEASVAFPSSMVDCIVPATGPRERSLAKDLGIDDAAPVTHENFRQWVIEDHFSAGRPAWERVGATFSTRVHDYETMKLRILNGGHQFVSDAGEILGIETISATMANPHIRGLFRKVASEEIAPHLHAVPGMTPEDYVDLIDRRFSNPAIVDTVRRVAFDGSSRHTGAVLPALRDALAAGSSIEGLALSQALWARMCLGTRENGTAILPNDPVWETLVAAARAARTRPMAWLEQRQIYGSLGDNARFATAFTGWLQHLYTAGVEASLAKYIDSGL
jgi:mannitol 2-dehydrogenase